MRFNLDGKVNKGIFAYSYDRQLTIIRGFYIRGRDGKELYIRPPGCRMDRELGLRSHGVQGTWGCTI